jgi:hypothetical protein
MVKHTLTLTVLLLAGTQALCLAQAKPEPKEKRIWGASHHITRVGDGKDTSLQFFDISQGPEHLLGSFSMVRQREGAPLFIHGHLNKSGEFTPNFSLQVSDLEDRDWKTIESSLSDKVDLTLTAAPHIERLLLRIQLDALQPYIGRFKFCRVVVQTGESEVLPMAWLTENGE